MNRIGLLLGAATLALLAAACGSGTPQASGPTPSLTANSPTIVAKNIKFVTGTVTAPAGRAFAMDFDNQDGAPHNVSIYTADGSTVFRGEVFGGSAHRTYAIPALTAGTYTFKCDVHPEMTGTLTAA
jgi:plastocyanin